MKIMIISHEYPPIGGGGANACMNLAREYAVAGHEVHVITVCTLTEGNDIHPVTTVDGVVIYNAQSKRAYAEHCSFLEMLSFVCKALPMAKCLEEKERFDICQIFFGIPSGPIGYYLKKKYGLPYVIRFGGGDIPGFQKRFTLLYKPLSPVIRTLWNNADALVANSRGLHDMAIAFHNKKPVMIIPNGADLHVASCVNNRMRGNTSSDTIRLLFVSRLIERKGLQDYLPYLSSLRDKFDKIGKRLELLIVGDGPYRAELESIVHKYDIDDIVLFKGQKDKTQLPEYYNIADIFIFTSHKEGMPNVILEAMSYGLPIITTPCEGTEELVTDNGFRAQVDQFNEAIMELISDDDAYLTMCDNSRKHVVEQFSWHTTANRYLELFESLLVRA